jgi:hypothetical protein
MVQQERNCDVCPINTGIPCDPVPPKEVTAKKPAEEETSDPCLSCPFKSIWSDPFTEEHPAQTSRVLSGGIATAGTEHQLLPDLLGGPHELP